MAADAEVIVVGGGPAGAATGALLARRGRDVLLIDKSAFPREKACAEYYSPGAVDALERLGVLGRVEAARPARPGGMRIVARETAFELTYPDGSRCRSALSIPRGVLDRILLDHAEANGVRVVERVRALAALVENRRVFGVVARVDGVMRELRSRFVVAADGLHSAIARSLDLEATTLWPRRLGLVARFDGPTLLRGWGEMHVGAGVYCGLTPVGSGQVSAGLVTSLHAKPAGEPVDRFFERSVAGLPGAAATLADAKRVTPIRGVGPLARRVRRTSGRGYLLVGDAAGFLDPFTGEGVHRALRGAELAADAIEQALNRDDCWPIGYDQARHVAFGAKERVCLLIQLFLTSPRAFAYGLGKLGARPAAARVVAGVLGDYEPARPALEPRFLWSLLRPW